jgi:hypothetical protein
LRSSPTTILLDRQFRSLCENLDIRMNWLMGIRLFSDFLFGKVRDMERRVRLEKFQNNDVE